MEYYLTIDLLCLNEWKDKVIIKYDNKTKKETKLKIDIIDSSIFSLIKKYQTGKYPGLCYNDGYVWLDGKKILSELPLLNIGLEALRKRLRKLYEFNLIEQRNKKSQSSTKSFFKISDIFWKVDKWYTDKYSIEKAYNGEERIEKITKHYSIKPLINIRKKPKSIKNEKRDLRGKFIKSDNGTKLPLCNDNNNGKVIPLSNEVHNGTKLPLDNGKIIPPDNGTKLPLINETRIINTNINNKDYYFSLIKHLNKKHKLLLCKNDKIISILDSLKKKEILDLDYLSFVAEKFENLKVEVRAGKFILALENELFEDEWKREGNKNINDTSYYEENNEIKKIREYILKLPKEDLEKYRRLALNKIPEKIKNDYLNKSDVVKYRLSKILLNEEVFNLVKEDILLKA